MIADIAQIEPLLKLATSMFAVTMMVSQCLHRSLRASCSGERVTFAEILGEQLAREEEHESRRVNDASGTR